MSINRIEQLHNMIKNSPTDTFLHYALGLEYIKQDNYKDAQQSFDTVLKIDNNYLPVYYQIGKLMEVLDKLDEAKKIYLSGIELARSQADMHTQKELETALALLDD